MVIVALVPGPDEILRNHNEECTIPVEKAQALPCLKKAKLVGFGHLSSAPAWLETAMKYLTMTDFELSLQGPWLKSEFSDKLANFKELWTDVLPDADVFANHKVQSLLMTIF